MTGGRGQVAAVAAGAALAVWPAAAWANTIIGRFLVGSGSALLATVRTWGGVLALIVLLEAVVLRRMTDARFGRALLASLVMNVVSTVTGWFSGVFSLLFLVAVYLPLLVVAWKLRAGGVFLLVSLAATVLGTLTAWPGWHDSPPQPAWIVLVLLAGPMLLGLGTSLVVEGLVASGFLPDFRRWRGLLVANAASYLVVLAAVVLMGPNAYQNGGFAGNSMGKIAARSTTPEQAVADLRARRASNLYLLGVSSDAGPAGFYRGHVERGLAYVWPELACRRPETATAIQADLARWGLPPVEPDPGSPYAADCRADDGAATGE